MHSFLNFLKKNKLYTAINITGLTVSMAFVLLLACYVTKQLRTDSFQQNADRLHPHRPVAEHPGRRHQSGRCAAEGITPLAGTS